MGINNAHYYGWEGKLHSPWWATLAIVRVALLQVFRRKSYWLVIGLGVFQFLMYWVIIYVLTQARLPADAQRDMFEWFGFSPTASRGRGNRLHPLHAAAERGGDDLAGLFRQPVGGHRFSQ